jgi:hypothetical protein
LRSWPAGSAGLPSHANRRPISSLRSFGNDVYYRPTSVTSASEKEDRCAPLPC